MVNRRRSSPCFDALSALEKMMRKRSSRLLFSTLALICLLSGCVGTTVIDYKVGIDVGYTGPDGRHLDLAAEPVVELPHKPGPLVAFNYMQFRDSLLSWIISVQTTQIGSRIRNLSDKPLVLRWDQALLASSQQAQDTPLQSYHSNVAGEWLGPKGFVPKSANRLHALVPLRLEPGQESNATFGARYAELFRSGRLFGARYDRGSTRLQKTGVGEWLLIKLPIEHGDERLMMHIKLTAQDAKARISYY